MPGSYAALRYGKPLPVPDITTLRIAIGDYPHTLPLKRGAITSPSLKLDFVEVKPMHMACKPMVREHAYDASELALIT
jgi:4,5-dihydroxyphthalate decarboxylase